MDHEEHKMHLVEDDAMMDSQNQSDIKQKFQLLDKIHLYIMQLGDEAKKLALPLNIEARKK
jgi:hypothetical protein